MINFLTKIIAVSWLIFKIGFLKTLKIFFELLTEKSKSQNVKFKFKGKNLKMLIRSQRTDLAMLTEIFCFQSYEIKKNIDPKLIIDAGANKGSATVYFGLKYPNAEIHCYEPNPDLIPILKENIRINGINAKIFNEAISDKKEELYFEINKNHQYSKLSKNNTGLKVKTISLNERYFGQKIDILKLDIEGEEEKVISSLNFTNPSIDIIIQEIHYDRVNFKKIFSILEKNNYKFENPYPQYFFLNSKVKRPILLSIKK